MLEFYIILVSLQLKPLDFRGIVHLTVLRVNFFPILLLRLSQFSGFIIETCVWDLQKISFYQQIALLRSRDGERKINHSFPRLGTFFLFPSGGQKYTFYNVKVLSCYNYGAGVILGETCCFSFAIK